MKKIPGKADEVRHILFLIPLVLQNIISDYENPVFALFTVMINLCRLVCARKISLSQIELLHHYINVYFEYRRECFPNINLRPKHHFLKHYPDLIQQFGPLKNLFSMHFEHKHQYFKNIAKKM